MSTFDSQVSKREIIETQIEHTRLYYAYKCNQNLHACNIETWY
jgi:hypothetical protein